MRTLPLCVCLFALALVCTFASRADEPATEPAHSTAELVADITAAIPKTAATAIRRDATGKVVEVRLSPSLLTPEVFTHLAKAHELQTLTVGCCIRDISKSFAPALAELNQLRTLRMFGCGADALPRLPARALPRLRTVFIRYQKVTPEIATAIASLPSLEELDLGCLSELSAKNLAPLARCPKLKSLSLASSDATDDLVEVLLQVKSLKTVDLKDAEFSEPALQRLRDAGLMVRVR